MNNTRPFVVTGSNENLLGSVLPPLPELLPGSAWQCTKPITTHLLGELIIVVILYLAAVWHHCWRRVPANAVSLFDLLVLLHLKLILMHYS